ncbi:hypothetical protein ACFY3U_19965 [Micromonospora sp. NPDC000089]|uniref:hypothetical protein n=1 Tax=unclassified Micromonospora TaxID=2617518 RepID=UPI00369882D4
MAFRTWGRLLLTALGVSVLAGAGQLGVAYGFGIVRLTGAFTDVNRWPAQLAWVGWFAVTAAVAGAVLTGRLARRDGLAGRTGGQVAISAAAALGALVVAPLCMQPARAAELSTIDPVWAVGICAVVGAVVGAGAASAVLLRPPLGWNVALLAAAVWLLALISVAPTLLSTGPLRTVRLGVLEPGWLGAGTAQRLTMVLLPVVALVVGVVTGAVARRRGHAPLIAAGSGAAGPVLLAFAYLTAGPGDAVDRYQLAPYYGAVIAVGTGALGSVAAALLRWPLVSRRDPAGDAIEPTDILAPLPDVPAPATGAATGDLTAVATGPTPANSPNGPIPVGVSGGPVPAGTGPIAGGTGPRPARASAPGASGSDGPAAAPTPAHWEWPGVTPDAGTRAASEGDEATAVPSGSDAASSAPVFPAGSDAAIAAPVAAAPDVADVEHPPGSAASRRSVDGAPAVEPAAGTDGATRADRTVPAGPVTAAEPATDAAPLASAAPATEAAPAPKPRAKRTRKPRAATAGGDVPVEGATSDVPRQGSGDDAPAASAGGDVPARGDVTTGMVTTSATASSGEVAGNAERASARAGSVAAGTPPTASTGVAESTDGTVGRPDGLDTAGKPGDAGTSAEPGRTSAAGKPGDTTAAGRTDAVATAEPARTRAAGKPGGTTAAGRTGETTTAGEPGETTAASRTGDTGSGAVAAPGRTGADAEPGDAARPRPALADTALPAEPPAGPRLTPQAAAEAAPRPRHLLPDLTGTGSWDAFRPAGPPRTTLPFPDPGTGEEQSRPAPVSLQWDAPGAAPVDEGAGQSNGAPAGAPTARRPKGRRGLFRRNRAAEATPDGEADRPLAAHDEEYVDWVAGLSRPLPDNEPERESGRRSLRSTGRHHRE